MTRYQSEVVDEQQARIAAIRDELASTIYRARSCVNQVSDPQARQLLEKTAEVLNGLVADYREYDRPSEHA